MLTKSDVVQDLKALGVKEGMRLIVHASLRSMGTIENGASTLIEAFREVLGAEGTLMVPTFTNQLRDHLCPDAAASEHRSDREVQDVESVFMQLVDHEPDDPVLVLRDHADAVALAKAA